VFTATSDARFASGGGVSLFVAHGRGDGSFDAAEVLVDDFPGGEPARAHPSGSLRLSPSGRRVSWLDGLNRRSARLAP
jgi:hypothetical protein